MLGNLENAYKLVGKVPVRCSLEEAMNSVRTIKVDVFGEVTVSTVFLVTDHSFSHSDSPVLFETMIFGGQYNDYQTRYHTYDEALEGHIEACELVNKVQIERNNKLKDLGLWQKKKYFKVKKSRR